MPADTTDPSKPLADASPEVREIVLNVLKWEKARLSKRRVTNKSEILEIIKSAVKEDEN